jgi:hypothetical protein
MAQNTELYGSCKSNYSATDHISDFKYMSEYDTTAVLTMASTFHKMLDMYTREIKHYAVPQIKIKFFQQLIYFP